MNTSPMDSLTFLAYRIKQYESQPDAAISEIQENAIKLRTSFQTDSLRFLADKLEEYEHQPKISIGEIEKRALQLRIYASNIAEHDSLEYEEAAAATEEQVEPEESPIDEIEEEDHSQNIPKSLPASLPPIPKIPGVDSDVLSNLLMSWFYTGYYTGLAEANSKKD